MSSNKKANSKSKVLKRAKQCRNCQKLIPLDQYDAHVEGCFRFKEDPINQDKYAGKGSTIFQKTILGNKKFEDTQPNQLKPKLNHTNPKPTQKVILKRPPSKNVIKNITSPVPPKQSHVQICIQKPFEDSKKDDEVSTIYEDKKESIHQKQFRVQSRPASGRKNPKNPNNEQYPIRVAETTNYLSQLYNENPIRIGNERLTNFHGIQHVDYLKSKQKKRKVSLSSESEYFSQQMITQENEKKQEEEDKLDKNWKMYLERQEKREKVEIQKQKRREEQLLKQYKRREKQRQVELERERQEQSRRQRQIQKQIQEQVRREREKQRLRQIQRRRLQDRRREEEVRREEERRMQEERRRQQERERQQQRQRQQQTQRLQEQYPDVAVLIENTNQIINFIESLPILQDQTLTVMLGQLRQLNTIANQIQQLNFLGNNLGFRMGHVFATRIQQLQTTIINQIGIALVRGFHDRISSQFEVMINQRPNINIQLDLGFTREQIQQLFPEKLSLREVDCSICLEDIRPGSWVKELQCEHVFHPSCIEQWLKGSKKCPMCRRAQVMSS